VSTRLLSFGMCFSFPHALSGRDQSLEPARLSYVSVLLSGLLEVPVTSTVRRVGTAPDIASSSS
jgi:hypothetical protein